MSVENRWTKSGTSPLTAGSRLYFIKGSAFRWINVTDLQSLMKTSYIFSNLYQYELYTLRGIFILVIPVSWMTQFDTIQMI